MKGVPFFKKWALSLIFFLVGGAWAADAPFDGPGNYGGTGLMETPNARIMKEGMIRIGVSQIDPYRSYWGALSPFFFLEIDGRFTEILGVPVGTTSPNWQGYGNYKDKVIDLKFQLLREGKYHPAIALGLMDPHGTRLFASQYLVASKQIYPFDFTVGFGNGRFGERPLPSSGDSVKVEMFQENSSWRREGRFFGSLQFALSEKLLFMLEYSPIKYELQPGPYNEKHLPSPASSPINVGLRFRPWKWLEADLTYQRGNQIGGNISLSYDLNQPMIPLYDQPYREKATLRLSPVEVRILTALENLEFSNIRLRTHPPDIEIEIQNDRFYYTPRAIGMVMKALADILGGNKDYVNGLVHLILSQNGVPILAFHTQVADLIHYYREDFTLKEYLSLTRFDTTVRENLPAPVRNRSWWNWGLRPSFQPFINDPSGFFKYRLGAASWISFTPWRGGAFIAGLEGYIQNTISSVNAPAAQAVRSDAWLYKKENLNLTPLMYEHIEKFPSDIYGRLSAGFLEFQYGGMDAELARPFFGGRLMLGLSGSIVKKRDTSEVFRFKENDWQDYYKTAFFNTRLNIPELEAYVDLKSGRFLAGDKGTRIQVSKFINGVILSAWWSFTDTSMFQDNFNNGYHDKGIALTIPLRMFKGSDSRTKYSFFFSPWTRDVAQDIVHFTELFDYIGRNVPIYLNKDIRIKGRGLEF